MASVSKRERNDGSPTKWVVRYTDHGGKKRLKTFDTKKLADGYRTKVETELQAGYHVADAASITVREAGEQWLEHCEMRMKLKDKMGRQCYETYRTTTRKHIYPFLGAVTLSKLTATVLQDWVYEMMQHPTAPRNRPMVKKAINCLRQIVSKAQRQGSVAHNVVKDAPPRIPGRNNARVEIPTKAELSVMLENATGRMRLILYTAVFTGMRMGEIRALTWEHVDFAEGVVRVRQAANKWGDIGPPKSEAGVRDIPLAPVLSSMLKQWKLECPITDEGLVFSNQYGKVLGANGFYQVDWYPLLEQIGLVDEDGQRKYHFHAMRHCAASLFIEQRLEPKRIQTYMGHSTIAMTYDTYGHMFENHGPAHAAFAAIERDLLGQNESPTEDAEIVQFGRPQGDQAH